MLQSDIWSTLGYDIRNIYDIYNYNNAFSKDDAKEIGIDTYIGNPHRSR